MVDENKELVKFLNNPKYRKKVIDRIHKDEDKAYDKRIKEIEGQKNKQIKERNTELARIEKSRWQDIGGHVLVNRTEGKVRINNSEVLFSSIKGAELNVVYGSRIVTTSNEKTKKKKHASLGGAVAGGLILGPVGAVAGGVGLAKTKRKTTGSTVSNQIPTCMHLGVQVNIDGFVSEVVLLSHQVDQSGIVFHKAQVSAQNLVSQLGVLANTPVPQTYVRVEDEASVKFIENRIAETERKLQEAIADRPTYAIPELYRTEEQKGMTDSQYLEYLSSTDAERAQEYSRIKEKEKQQRTEERALKQVVLKEKIMTADYSGGAKKIGSLIINIIMWCISIIVLLFAIIEFSENGIVSGLLLILTSFIVNPLGRRVLKEKVRVIPYWVCIIIAVECFFASMMLAPSVNNTKEGASQEVTSIDK